MLLRFYEWISFSEGDDGLGAFVDPQNTSFEDFRQKLLRAGGLTRAEGAVLPAKPQRACAGELPAAPGHIRFREYVAACEGLLLPDKPAKPGMPRINPFPATQKKLQRVLARRPAPASAAGFVAQTLAAAPPTPKPVPSPLQAARDAFAGYF
jgi:hypothetical protein